MQSATPSATRSSAASARAVARWRWPRRSGARSLGGAHGIRRRSRSRSRSSAPPATRSSDRPLADAGGKGLFTKEIEEALIAGTIDLAVHSAKDMPTILPTGLRIAAVLEREDARDVFISPRRRRSRACRPARASAPPRCAVRRSSSGCAATLMSCRMRGNVETRLRKLDAGEVDATLLALAGLEAARAWRRPRPLCSPVDEFLPAVGQGDHRHRSARR